MFHDDDDVETCEGIDEGLVFEDLGVWEEDADDFFVDWVAPSASFFRDYEYY